jgi:biotin carboxyl carrier protein
MRGTAPITYEVQVEGHSYKLELKQGERGWQCKLDGEEVAVDAVRVMPDLLSLIVNGAAYEIRKDITAADLRIWVKNVGFKVEVRNPRSLRGRRGAKGAGEGPQRIVAPMPGRIVRVMAAAGAEVEAGQGLVVIEAMKMQNELKSSKKGIVKQILASEGSTVNAGDVLAVVE